MNRWTTCTLTALGIVLLSIILVSVSPACCETVLVSVFKVHPLLNQLLPLPSNHNNNNVDVHNHRRRLEEEEEEDEEVDNSKSHEKTDLATLLADSGASLRLFGPTIDSDSGTDVYQHSKQDDIAMAWFTPSQQRQFLQQRGNHCWSETTEDVLKKSTGNSNAVVQRYDELAEAPFLQVEVWKFCMLATGMGNAFWDRDQVVPLFLWQDIWDSMVQSNNDNHNNNMDRSTALLVNHGHSETTNAASNAAWIHSAFLRLDGKYANTLSQNMLRLLLETEEIVLTANPLYTYRALAQHFQNDGLIPYLWEAKCQVPAKQNPADQVLVQQPNKKKPVTTTTHNHNKWKKRKSSSKFRTTSEDPPPELSHLPTFGLHCTIPGGYCCQVWNPDVGDETPVFLVKHPFGTTGGLTKPRELSTTTLTTMTQHYPADPVPYWSTITSIPNKDATGVAPSKLETPNFFDILLQNNCLPTSAECRSCLKKATSNAGCDEQCAEDCPCYCKVLCQIRPPPKRVQAVWYVSPPLYQEPASQQPQRLIPRIIHQTWYEPLDPEKYPNMSRLMSSWKHSGWKHVFYDDATAATFLEQHFPPQVLEAYHAIQPGAFKADLFRYCVLLIQGGVYADMDVLLETNLELAIDPDVGFMTPIDEPGIRVQQQSCLWNGFMAVAPGHPFVAKTIEIVVNNIRNRFTSVDYDDMLCPSPILSTSHSFDILFTTGPCILGTAMNMILQRHPQTAFTPGELDIWGGESSTTTDDGQSQQQQQRSTVVEPEDPRLAIPGRSIILRQNKQDMGAHRFTLDEKNLIMCSTDMPEYDDRPKKPHYAESGKLTPLYGTTKLYSDTVAANEEIRVVVVRNDNNFTL